MLGLRDHTTIGYALKRAPTHLAALGAVSRRRLAALLPDLVPAPPPAPEPEPAAIVAQWRERRAMTWWAAQAQPQYQVAAA